MAMRMGRSLMMVAGVVSLLALGACSKSGSMPDSSAADEQAGARDPGYGDVSALSDIYFDFDRSEIRADQQDVLAANAEWIKANEGVKIQVEGHCDERGTEEYNLALGERRANSVRDFLISYGVAADRLYTISYGEELPVDPANTPEAWAKNRRAHFLATR